MFIIAAKSLNLGMLSLHSFHLFLLVMALIAVAVFICLFFVDAGYGKFCQPKWGPSVGNRLGWILMEAPVFIAMLLLWWFSDRKTDPVRLVFLLLFELHYFHRSFIFPLQIRGRSRMPLSIILMGAFGPTDTVWSWLMTLFGINLFGSSITGSIYSFGYTLLIGAIFNLVIGVALSKLMVKSLSSFKFLRKPWLFGGKKDA